MDRTRQAVFNMLRARDVLNNATVLDVCAGSGAYGFEALSQNASHATFFEKDPLALHAMKQTIKELACADHTSTIQGDARKPPPCKTKPATLLFCDPPYDQEMLPSLLQALHKNGWIDSNSLLVLECRKDEKPMDLVTILDSRIYGSAQIIFAVIVDGGP
jgi:16S rRNA (guanine966-N2)-methyltransferase